MPCAVLQCEEAGPGSCCNVISEGQLVIKDRSHRAFIAPGADDCDLQHRLEVNGVGECLVWRKSSSDIKGRLIVVTFLWSRQKKEKKSVNTQAL